MNKVSVILPLFTVIFVSGAVAQQARLSAEPADMDKMSQDADRNRELLEIWKDHVKTLTKERDDAYRELERVKASGGSPGVAQFGGVETAPLPMMNAEAAQQIDGLQTEVMRLQTELQRKASSDPNRELQMQFSSLQRQLQQVKKELTDVRAEKDKLIQEKERALAQAERLSGGAGGSEASDVQSKRYEELEQRFIALERENESLRQKKPEAPKQQQAAPKEDTGRIRDLESKIANQESEINQLRQKNLQFTSAAGDPDREKETIMRQARELQYENESLRAQIEKLQVVEKELANTRGYFNPLVKELQQKNDRYATDVTQQRVEIDRVHAESTKLSNDVLAARTQAQNIQKEADRAHSEIDSMKTKVQQADADLASVRAERDQFGLQIENLKGHLQNASADREKLLSTEQELRRMQEQFTAQQNATTQLAQNAEGLRTQVQQLSTEVSTLESANRDYSVREAANAKAAEKYQAALRANTTDMKNLKSNFEAYLESLVASFEERQK